MLLGSSYIPPHQPSHIEEDIKYMASLGCGQVLFALQENHFQWLDGSIRFGAKIAKDYGLIPRACIWGFANTSGGGRSSRVMLENPDMWRCDEEGVAYGGGYPYPMACYNNPKMVAKFGEYVEICAENGFESIMIDEPTNQVCFCKHCREKFTEMFDQPLDKMQDSAQYKVFEFSTVTDFVYRSVNVCKVVSKDIETSICMMPVDKDKFEKIASIPKLDVFGTDPYWLRPINKLSFEDAVNITKYGKKIAEKNNKKYELYLGCFGIDSGLEEKIYSGGKILVDSGSPDYVTAWSFRGGIGLSNLSSEECENPELAWDSIVKLYREVSANLSSDKGLNV
ncbi:MAG: hypothetical protein ACIAQZ_00200 [Sedimentisphaeraceae bacterium JB056]